MELCQMQCLQEWTIIFSNISRIRTLQYLAVHISSWSILCGWLVYTELRPVAYAGYVVYQKFLITVLGGGGGGGGVWDKLCSHYGMILIFDNYGHPLRERNTESAESFVDSSAQRSAAQHSTEEWGRTYIQLCNWLRRIVLSNFPATLAVDCLCGLMHAYVSTTPVISVAWSLHDACLCVYYTCD